MPENQQTHRNHRRNDPAYHFFLLPALLLFLLWSIIHLVRYPGTIGVAFLGLAIVLPVMSLKLRSYPLKVQDRLIRLEERLRLSQLLPERLRARIPELSESQLIALRFASDAEIPGLVERALNEKLNRKQIKAAIQNWRADHWRV